MNHLPQIVAKLCYNFDSWIVGSQANPDATAARDWDVLVPWHLWHQAVAVIGDPFRVLPNSFGGWKIYDKDLVIDIWPGDLSWLCQNDKFNMAFHPRSGVRIQKIKP